jgi:hypothetical protein
LFGGCNGLSCWVLNDNDKGMNLGKNCKKIQINRVVVISKWFSWILMKKIFINWMISYNEIWAIIIQLKGYMALTARYMVLR